MGIVFLLFDSLAKKKQFLKNFDYCKDFLHETNSKLIEDLNIASFAIRDAPCPSDIEWKNFYEKSFLQNILYQLMNLCLFLLTCVIFNSTIVTRFAFNTFIVNHVCLSSLEVGIG